MLRRALITLVLLFSFIAPNASAQQVSESHQAAARRLLEVMEVEKTMIGAATAMADAAVAQDPAMARYRDVLLEWAEDVITWENFEPEFVKIYTGAYTEAELRDLIRFYETPVGKKSIRLMPELMMQGTMVGNDVAIRHSEKLRVMIEARDAELNQ